MLASYRRQLNELHGASGICRSPSGLEALLALPGVVNEQTAPVGRRRRTIWPLIHETLEAAMRESGQMREEEGRAMAADLAANCRRSPLN